MAKKNPSKARTERRTSWVLIYPAEDVAGSWVAHMLDLDVVSFGDSIAHALKMVLEATMLCVRWDLEAGKHPFTTRKRAPASEYKKVKAALFEGTFTPDLRELAAATAGDPPDLVLTQIHVFLRSDLREADVRPSDVYAA
jgi:predicted RNase H-like HicB family nuclease